jgi:hypothetical protein
MAIYKYFYKLKKLHHEKNFLVKVIDGTGIDAEEGIEKRYFYR